MNEELQLREGSEEQMVANDEMATFDPTEDMSDDDLAANLGFLTSLSESTLPQGDDGEMAEGEEMQEEEEAVPEEVVEEEADPLEEEVADIRKELEELKASIENEEDTETEEDTGASE